MLRNSETKSETYVMVPGVYATLGNASLPYSSRAGRISHVERVVAIMAKVVPALKYLPGQKRRPNPKTTSSTFSISASPL
jgi:hypothetical protein